MGYHCTKTCENCNGTSTRRSQSTDLREQLFNQRLTGAISAVATPTEQVCQLHGILYDIDVKLFRVGGTFKVLPQMNSRDLFQTVIQPMLFRHPVLECLEVRCSGEGLHGLLWLDSPILLRTSNDVRRWEFTTGVVQAALPIDSNQPRLNALTRPIGSVNSKNGQVVEQIKQGTPASEDDIIHLFREMQRNPYAMIQKIWFGSEHIEPCPVCNCEGSYLEVTSENYGECYGNCHRITIDRLVNSILDFNHTNSKGKKQ